MHNSLCTGSVHRYCASHGADEDRPPGTPHTSGSTTGRFGRWPTRCGCGCSGALRIDGPATATALAEMLGTNTGATSYHLRQLAEVGLVAEDPDLGTGRQRSGGPRTTSPTGTRTDFDDDPDARAAIEWIEADQVGFHGRARRALVRRPAAVPAPGATPSA